MRTGFADSGQHLFNWSFHVIGIALKMLIRAIIYLPLLVTGYLVASTFLQRQDNLFAWIGLIVLFAYTLYLLLYFLKGILIAFKNQANLLWVLLFVLCTAFTCVLPIWATFDSIEKLMMNISKPSAEILTWIASAGFGIFIYSRYHFLTNIAPLAVFPIYQLGINLAFNMMRISSTIKGEKSRQFI